MKITKTLHARSRSQWRAWLRKHHQSQDEIWLIYYKKHSGKKRIPYNDAVEEALCFGWIDGIVKGIDASKYAQRFTPRRRGSFWSAANKERVRRLIRKRVMTGAGLAAFQGRRPESAKPHSRWTVPSDIRSALQKNKAAWRTFRKLPASYKRVRIGWIDASRRRPDVFLQRLRYFIHMTAQGKRFGMVR